MDKFKENAPEFLALYWHVKLRKDSWGNEFEALFVLVSGPITRNEGKFLGVLLLAKATGKAQADALLTFEA